MVLKSRPASRMQAQTRGPASFVIEAPRRRNYLTLAQPLCAPRTSMQRSDQPFPIRFSIRRSGTSHIKASTM
jgi:hypothetical protein